MATKTSALNAALLEAGTAGEILAALGAVEYRRLHPGRDWSGSVDVEPWCAWLSQCPGAALDVTSERWMWITGCFMGALPTVARGPWVTFHDAIVAFLHRPHGWTRPPEFSGTCIEALHSAWRLVRSCDDDGTLDIAALERIGKVDTAAIDDVLPGHDAREYIERFTVDFPAAVARMRTVAKDWPGGVPDGHPLGPVMAAWLASRTIPVSPFEPRRRASLPRLHRITEALPGFPAHLAPSSTSQLCLPGIGSMVAGCPSWLLWMFDAAGGESMAQGRGAPWPMRLFVGALLHLSIAERDGEWHTLRFPVFDVQNETGRIERSGVTSWLHPGGWQNRRRDWSRFPAALDAMRDRLAYVPVQGLGDVAMLVPSVIPRAMSDPIVEFTIRVPRSAARGARISWPRLCEYGTESAALYRAYLSVSAHLDHSARSGHPITRLIGAPVLGDDGKPKRRTRGAIIRSSTELEPNPSAHYVPFLTDGDLARMIGFDGDNRFRRRDARKAFERLDDDGIIDLVPEHRGFRLYGPRAFCPIQAR